MHKMEEIKKKVEKEIENINQKGITKENLDVLYKLVDIHKDIMKEEEIEMEMEESDMRYNEGYSAGGGNSGGYGNYGRRRRDSMGRFREGNSNSGRRRYRGMDEMEMIDRMGEGYSEYREGMEYGAKEDGMEALEYMLESFVQFYEYLMNNADSQEEVEMIKKYAKKIKDM